MCHAFIYNVVVYKMGVFLQFVSGRGSRRLWKAVRSPSLSHLEPARLEGFDLSFCVVICYHPGVHWLYMLLYSVA